MISLNSQHTHTNSKGYCTKKLAFDARLPDFLFSETNNIQILKYYVLFTNNNFLIAVVLHYTSSLVQSKYICLKKYFINNITMNYGCQVLF